MASSSFHTRHLTVVIEWVVLVFFLCHAAARGPCDPLVPQYCVLPFPNSFYTVTDASTETGLRVNFNKRSFPRNLFGRRIKPDTWNSFGMCIIIYTITLLQQNMIDTILLANLTQYRQYLNINYEFL